MSFTFKQFHIDDTHCAMKVGTDGVLLGAWAPTLPITKHILDIGCGSGLISLMLAQRTPNAQVTGIEIDAQATIDAKQNVAQSPFANRVNIVCNDILHYAQSCAQRFDCIVSNPPYYEEAVLPPSSFRAKARHTTGGGLTFEALLHSVNMLLDTSASNSYFSIILPAQGVNNFITLASFYHLNLMMCTHVRTRPNKPCKRMLLCFSPHEVCPRTDELILVNHEGTRSAQYDALCQDFYL